MPVVLDPFEDIAVHVVETPTIWRISPDLAGAAQSRVGVIGVASRNSVAERIAARRAGTAGVFPFGFRRQPIRLSGRLRQPGNVSLRIIPADINDRPPPPSPGGVGRFLSSRRLTEPVVLVERHRIPPDRKMPGNRHAV